jgi:TorA maturation chaperone TorD
VSALAAVRHAAYRFFSLAFLYPDRGRRGRLRQLAQALAAERVARGLAFFPAWRECWERLGRTPGDELEALYVQLFDLAGRPGSCSLCESAYRDAPWQVVADLREQYRRAGVEPGGPEPADHLSVELEYLSVLVKTEAGAWEAGGAGLAEVLARQRHFLQAHPCGWVPELVACVRRRDPTGPYAAAAAALESFLQHEVDLTSLLLRDAVERERAG